MKAEYDFRTKRITGTYEWFRCYFVSIENEFGNIDRIVGGIKNIQKEKEEQARMEEKTQIDSMTGLLNKVATKRRIDEYLLEEGLGGKHALMLVDLDKFKLINDNLGHIIGDQAIMDVVSAMKEVFCNGEYMGRVGGDEFVVFMKNADVKKVKMYTDHFCLLVKRKYNDEMKEAKLSCSVGIAYYEEDGMDYTSLFSKADIAMYYSKLQGGNRLTEYKEIIDVI